MIRKCMIVAVFVVACTMTSSARAQIGLSHSQQVMQSFHAKPDDECRWCSPSELDDERVPRAFVSRAVSTADSANHYGSAIAATSVRLVESID